MTADRHGSCARYLKIADEGRRYGTSSPGLNATIEEISQPKDHASLAYGDAKPERSNSSMDAIGTPSAGSVPGLPWL